MPAVLAAHHGPFTWGRSAMDSVNNSIALETCARMALATLELDSQAGPIPDHYLRKHYLRKHGPSATYGQSGD
jgi:L-ribulose-5-phosphate 4-epimerase